MPPLDATYPIAVQLPADAHETPVVSAHAPLLGRAIGVAVPHVPLVEVTANGLRVPFESLKVPTAVQVPSLVHSTSTNLSLGVRDWNGAVLGNTTGVAVPHVPLMDVIVNDWNLLEESKNLPTAVQLPGDVHDTAANSDSVGFDCAPLGNTAGRTVPHTPLVDVMVKGSMSLCVLVVYPPTAVQLPGDVHDTDVMPDPGIGASAPAGKTAGVAMLHTDVAVACEKVPTVIAASAQTKRTTPLC